MPSVHALSVTHPVEVPIQIISHVTEQGVEEEDSDLSGPYML